VVPHATTPRACGADLVGDAAKRRVLDEDWVRAVEDVPGNEILAANVEQQWVADTLCPMKYAQVIAD
jgi:hypothetical protein